MSAFFISCDWGTTNFRLRVVRRDDLGIVTTLSKGRGIRELFGDYQKRPDASLSREAFFLHYLWETIDRLPQGHRHHPVVVSGMASSNIGLRNLPYGELPLTASGANLICDTLSLPSGQPLYLVSGVKSDTGIMRGEETQALGLLSQLPAAGQGVLLLPGTHAKHLVYRNGAFTDFASYLTGELFALLRNHSILADSLASGPWNSRVEAYFQEGVDAGGTDRLSRHLFGIRAGHVLRATNPQENYYRLSGLLIGDELASLPEEETQAVYLAGTEPLLSLYRVALEFLGFGERLRIFREEELTLALLTGQRQLLLRQATKH